MTSPSKILSKLDFFKEPDPGFEERISRMEMEHNEMFKEHCYWVEKRGATTLSKEDIQTKNWGTYEIYPETEQAINQIKRWSPGLGRGLLLQGETGTGKSHALKAVVIQWASQTYQCKYITASELFKDLKAGFEDHSTNARLEAYIAADFLAIDDIGAEKTSDWTVEQIISIMDARACKKKLNLMTTNLNSTDLTAIYGNRFFDRILETMNVVPIKCVSYRRRMFDRNKNW